MCNASTHVRFTPNSDRESGFPHKVKWWEPETGRPYVRTKVGRQTLAAIRRALPAAGGAA